MVFEGFNNDCVKKKVVKWYISKKKSFETCKLLQKIKCTIFRWTKKIINSKIFYLIICFLFFF
jgi:hypothetical protein